MLQKQIKAVKDDPILKECLESALKKLTKEKQQPLPLKDEREPNLWPKPRRSRIASTRQPE
eukprot:5791915-Amphidinium_carterae.2